MHDNWTLSCEVRNNATEKNMAGYEIKWNQKRWIIVFYYFCSVLKVLLLIHSLPQYLFILLMVMSVNLDYKVLNGGVIVNSTIRNCRKGISGSLFEVVFQSLSGQIETIHYKLVQMANFQSHFKQSTWIARSKIGLEGRKRSNKI